MVATRNVIAMYVRLSEEDRNVDGIAKVESDSIANQRKLITSFISKRAEFDDYEIKEYCDDGFSGTNFNREGITNLIEDVKCGLITCVIVKDFSRFGRNYIEVGNYLEFVFPALQVRFISINDGYDSNDFVGRTGGMDVAIKNIIYSMYSTNMSKNTKAALVTRHKAGKCVSPFAKFGYKKAEDDKSKLVIDDEAAEIVRYIFQLALEGNTPTAIAKRLNQEGVLTVGEYKEKHSNFRMGTNNKKRMWESSSIRDIIHDELYIGNMVWNRTSKSITSGSKKIRKPKEEWQVTPNTHEPIVSKEIYDKVQELCPLSTKRGWHANSCAPSKALFFCKECGRALLKNTNKHCYECRTASMQITNSCTVQMDIDELENTVCEYVRQTASLFIGNKAVKKDNASEKEDLLRQIESARKRQKSLSSKKMEYYANYRDGSMSRDEFVKISERTKLEVEELESRIAQMNLDYEALCKTVTKEAEENFSEIKLLQTFDKELLLRVVEKVVVHGPEEIEVIWKCDDIFKSCLV